MLKIVTLPIQIFTLLSTIIEPGYIYAQKINNEILEEAELKYNSHKYLDVYWFSGNRTKQGSDLRWKIGYNIPTV